MRDNYAELAIFWRTRSRRKKSMEPTVPLRPLPLNKILNLTKKKHQRRGRRGTLVPYSM